MIPSLRPLIATLAVVVAATLLAGCGVRSEPTGSTAGAFPATIENADGSTLVVAAAPRRIVSADPAATATLAALGVQGVVASVTPQAVASTPAGDLTIIPAGYAGAMPTHGVVLTWPAPTTTGAGRAIAMLGVATGRGGAGVALGRSVDAAVTATIAATRPKPPTRVLIDDGLLSAVGPETAFGALVSSLNATNIVSASGSVTAAAIRHADPQVWLVVAPSTTALAVVRHTPDFAGVTAARTARVVRVNPQAYEPSPQLPANLAVLARILHPAG
jgi:ABC-type Fe3+-hydroxamate transport system substrate-binding protein